MLQSKSGCIELKFESDIKFNSSSCFSLKPKKKYVHKYVKYPLFKLNNEVFT